MKKPHGLNLLEGSLVKNIIKLGYPMALGSLAQTLYDLADAFWLGKLGKAALSAPTISFFIIFFLISLALGFSVSGTSLVSQYIGAKQNEQANKAAGNVLFYLILLSLLFAGAGLLLDRQLLGLLKTPEDAFDLTLSYYRIVMAGMPLAFPIFVYQSVMNGYGDTISPLKISLFTAGVNVILDPILIFGWLGLPALGVAGAALATVFTRGMGSAIGLYLFFSGKKGIHLKLRHLKPAAKMSGLVFKIGVPSALGFSGASLGFIVLMSIVNLFGTIVISAYGIGMRVVHLFMLPAMGISAAVTAIVGQNLGAGNTQRAKNTVGKGIMLMCMVVIPAVILTAIFGKQVTQVFIPGDFLIHQVGQTMFYILPLSVLFFGLSTVLQGAFQGSGDTVPVMVTQILRIWLFRIPFVYLLSIVLLNGPADIHASVGIWWGMVISNIATFFMLFAWYMRGKWAVARIKKE
ncbi:MAG: MATE family efflux transporter [Candidatus Aminicenantes bacterium]|nr:MATE family efflux transporter [Candidatus Aminicenantes bacterium]NIM85069.1 MATE family efflux transporter [Candidatus Aminicenantes bacterium]NIN24576.1 MATE family efflux transporter [Candidatus Aminicenantes bacterium]NIN48340.1 MATE family efflux transporter [Candidatus Aminicenantes bacterium]NIN91243.1 MATE family efflux transporter [Candidatus Aminicenantes bacterium]